jgi:tetratricopeptide (TPR) repeat protein
LVAAGAASAEETLLQLRQRPPASVEQIRQLPPATDWRRSAQSLIQLQTVPEPVSPSISEIDASPPSRVAPGPASALTVTKEARRRPPATDRREPAPGIQLRMDWLLQALPADERVAHAEVDTEGAARSAPLEDTLQRSEAGDSLPDLAERIRQETPALLASQDPDRWLRVAWALYRQQDDIAAATWFQRVLAARPESLPAREGLFYTWRRLGLWEEALAVAEPVVGLARARADVAVELALAARERGEWEQARAWLERAQSEGRHDEDVERLLAWTTLQAGEVAEAAYQFEALLRRRPEDDELAQGLWLALRGDLSKSVGSQLLKELPALARVDRRERAQRWRDAGLAIDAAALDEPADPALQGLAQPRLTLAWAQQDRSGEVGTSRLRVQRQPSLQWQWWGYDAAWTLTLEQQQFDVRGPIPLSRMGSALESGSPPAVAERGWGWELQGRALGPQGWRFRLGSTAHSVDLPATWTGAIGWRQQTDDRAWEVQGFRRALQESRLAATGWRDPASGQPWGRVLGQGVRIEGNMAWPTPRQRIGAEWFWERLSGVNVASNTHRSVDFSWMHDGSLPSMRWAAVGPYLTFEQYGRRLSDYHWGHGGYFSPQRLLSSGIRAAWQTREPHAWVLAGQAQVGWQTLREDAAPCFALPPPITPGPCEGLSASRNAGWTGSLALQGAWRLDPRWALVGSVLLRSAPSYREHGWTLGLRYHWAPRGPIVGQDLPAPLR